MMHNVIHDHNYTAAIINLGCKVNKYEADSMKQKLVACGFDIVLAEDVADVYLVNTCSVTNIAEKKSRQMLRRAKKRNPKAVVVACGCYVNAAHDILKQAEYVDIVISNNRKNEIAQILLEYLGGRNEKTIECSGYEGMDVYTDISSEKEYEEMGSLDASYMDHQRAYVKIQDGCNQFCSYCIIPYTRGRVRSRKPEQIIEEIRQLASSGVREFVLTGIHISSYGVDFENNEVETVSCGKDEEPKMDAIRDLGDLIVAVASVPQVCRVRLGSLEPRIITEDFLDKIRNVDNLCPHFHLSLQSACDATLKRMNRRYSFDEFRRKCIMLRQCYDRPAITTDVIVGFPGETEEEFETTYDNLLALGLYEIHVFKYSVRKGTIAEGMPMQISEKVKNERSNRLLELTKIQKQAYEKNLSGLTDEVLIEEETTIDDKRFFTGHTKRYVRVYIEDKGNYVNQIIQYTF